mgnify:CR=1 FL=1
MAISSAAQWEAEGQLGPAAIAFGKLAGYSDARERSMELWDQVAVRDTISTEYYSGSTAGVKKDGTIEILVEKEFDSNRV